MRFVRIYSVKIKNRCGFFSANATKSALFLGGKVASNAEVLSDGLTKCVIYHIIVRFQK